MAKAFDGTQTLFPSLHDELVEGGTPLDSFAEGALRNQEYWLARRQGGDTGAHRPRQVETRWASLEWRTFWMGRVPLRRGLKSLKANIYGTFFATGFGGDEDGLQLAIDLVGIARKEIGIATDASNALQELELTWDEPLDLEVDEALLVLEMRSRVDPSDITWLTESSSPITATWRPTREISVDATAAYDNPTEPQEIFALRTSSDEQDGYQYVELRGGDFYLSNLSLNVFPTLRPGDGGVYELGRVDIGSMLLEGVRFEMTWEPDGAAPSFIDYPLTQLRPNIVPEGRVVSVHDHNSSGIYERHPLWRSCWHDGSSHDDGETVVDVRWAASRIQEETGTLVAASLAPTAIRVPREDGLVRCFFDLLLWTRQAPGVPDAVPASWVQTLTLRLVASQYANGSSSPTTWTKEVEVITRVLNAKSPDYAGSDLLAQLNAGGLVGGGWREDVGWREHIFDLPDALALMDTFALDLELTGADPDRPVGFHIEVEPVALQALIPAGAAIYAATLSRTLFVYGRPF